MMAMVRWIMAAKLELVLSVRMSMYLNYFSLQKKFPMRWRHQQRPELMLTLDTPWMLRNDDLGSAPIQVGNEEVLSNTFLAVKPLKAMTSTSGVPLMLL